MRIIAAISAIIGACVLLNHARAEDNPSGSAPLLGQWLTDGGLARVEIWKPEKPAAGSDESKEDELKDLYGTYCGKIVWLKQPEFPQDDEEAGKPKHDRKNPDPSKRDKPIVGLFMLKGFTAAGEGKWTGGTIYDPENGKTYKCQITMAPDRPKVLNLRGYIGIPALGRTTVWTRYEPPKEEAAAGENAPVPAK